MVEWKDESTEALCERILQTGADARETDRAAPRQNALSFESRIDPVRSVWIDVISRPGSLQIEIDLEDARHEETWDHKVATLFTGSPEAACAVIHAWLAGATVDECSRFADPDGPAQ